MRRRFVQINGELVEVSQDWRPEPQADYHVMPDFDPFVDNTGTPIMGRAHYREHLKKHDAVEMGHSDFKNATQRPHPVTKSVPNEGRKEAVKLAFQMIAKQKRPLGEVRAYLDNVRRINRSR